MENAHALKFTQVKKFCKFAHENGYNCMNGANTRIHQSVCGKNYCPMFNEAEVVTNSKPYEHGVRQWQQVKRQNTMGVRCDLCGEKTLIFFNGHNGRHCTKCEDKRMAQYK